MFLISYSTQGCYFLHNYVNEYIASTNGREGDKSVTSSEGGRVVLIAGILRSRRTKGKGQRMKLFPLALEPSQK